ncbi:MAG TPA: hypothetical protein DDY31_12110, partial [Lachnospiraceae bacterium]|nr:hypothetical protein [Lachnospiraceae bacterium]
HKCAHAASLLLRAANAPMFAMLAAQTWRVKNLFFTLSSISALLFAHKASLCKQRTTNLPATKA